MIVAWIPRAPDSCSSFASEWLSFGCHDRWSQSPPRPRTFEGIVWACVLCSCQTGRFCVWSRQLERVEPKKDIHVWDLLKCHMRNETSTAKQRIWWWTSAKHYSAPLMRGYGKFTAQSTKNASYNFQILVVFQGSLEWGEQVSPVAAKLKVLYLATLSTYEGAYNAHARA